MYLKLTKTLSEPKKKVTKTPIPPIRIESLKNGIESSNPSQSWECKATHPPISTLWTGKVREKRDLHFFVGGLGVGLTLGIPVIFLAQEREYHFPGLKNI